MPGATVLLIGATGIQDLEVDDFLTIVQCDRSQVLVICRWHEDPSLIRFDPAPDHFTDSPLNTTKVFAGFFHARIKVSKHTAGCERETTDGGTAEESLASAPPDVAPSEAEVTTDTMPGHAEEAEPAIAEASEAELDAPSDPRLEPFGNDSAIRLLESLPRNWFGTR